MTGSPSGQHSYGQYLAGLCVAGLGVCAAGWLVVTAFAFAGPVSGTPGGKWNDAAVTTLVTGAGLALIAAVTFACWARAWLRLLLADGVVAREAGHRSRRQVRRARRDRAMVARERAQRVGVHKSSGGVTGSGSEPEPVRPANADRVLSELRDQLGPLMTAPDTKHPPAGAPEAQGPSGPQGASRPDGGADLVAMCADGVISYDPEEDW